LSAHFYVLTYAPWKVNDGF